MSWFQGIIDWFKHLFDWLLPSQEVPSPPEEEQDQINIEPDLPDVPEEPSPVEDIPATTTGIAPPAKKALLVGVDEYNDPQINLQGCVADIVQMKELLMSKGFTEENIVTLTNSAATKRNILSELDKLITTAKEGEELVFHFSGHGSQVVDMDNDEPDRLDEILIPHDLNWNGGYVSDDDIAKIFKKLPQGVMLSMISDSCHSGTISRDTNTMVRYITPPQNILQTIFTTKGLVLNPVGLRTDGGTQRHVLLTGCKSNQTSMSAVIGGNWHGVLTYFFTARAQKGGTWKEVVEDVIVQIKNSGYPQDPQLTGEDSLLNRNVFGG